jgi:SAM-dependent methyltransferase
MAAATKESEILSGAYYVACQARFRQATTQDELMLAEVERRCGGLHSLQVLSIGAGSGLFELPMLERLLAAGAGLQSFTGIDTDAYACKILQQRLVDAFEDELEFEVVAQDFVDYDSRQRFDLVLLNHVFEYIPDQHAAMIAKARGLLGPDGQLLIFSPQRGGINRIYEREMRAVRSWPPIFAEDIAAILAAGAIPFEATDLVAQCDISALAGDPDSAEPLELLSFLTQIDCRRVPSSVRADYVASFQSLAPAGQSQIPHPTTLFVLPPAA